MNKKFEECLNSIQKASTQLVQCNSYFSSLETTNKKERKQLDNTIQKMRNLLFLYKQTYYRLMGIKENNVDKGVKENKNTMQTYYVDINISLSTHPANEFLSGKNLFSP